MLSGAVAKLIIAIVILIVTCRFVAKDDILLVIAQTVFSAVVIEDAIRLIIFTQRIKALYSEAYHEFITVGISTASIKNYLRNGMIFLNRLRLVQVSKYGWTI